MELIAHGAEAKLYRDGDKLVKERIPKAYRLPELDKRLRAFRTRREAKMFERLQALGFPAPALRSFSDTSMRIEMDFLHGTPVKDVLQQNPTEFVREIGRKIGLLHKADIIHSDLTTSNMILSNGEIKFIDFGLSFVSQKIEDKAVDLHLFDRALYSAHGDIYEQCIPALFEGYRESYPEAEAVLARLKIVQLRGRNKKKQAIG
ncbi:MAG: KEOPS complex kinase/ATPase Bud32 [Candidatus Woesearchaeota archaeon]